MTLASQVGFDPGMQSIEPQLVCQLSVVHHRQNDHQNTSKQPSHHGSVSTFMPINSTNNSGLLMESKGSLGNSLSTRQP